MSGPWRGVEVGGSGRAVLAGDVHQVFGSVTALEVLHVTGKNWDRSMQHTCSKHAAWDPHIKSMLAAAVEPFWRETRGNLAFSGLGDRGT